MAGTAVTQTGAYLRMDETKLYERRWSRVTAAQELQPVYNGVAYLCHGFAEHCGYFQPLAESLARVNFLVVGLDCYGHGLSDGSVNKLKSFDTFVTHAANHLALLREEFPGLPIHGVGYSMGALILHRVSNRCPQLLRSMIWLSPALQPTGMKLTKRRVQLSKRLMKYLPNLPLPGGTFMPRDLTRCKETQEQMRRDPSIKQRTLYSRMCALMLEAMLYTMPEAVCVPVLVATGTADRIADAARSASFVAAAQSLGKPVASRVYPGGHHQLHTDLPAAGVALHQDLLHWLNLQPAAC